MDNGKWIMDNGELMMPFCIEIFHYPFFIIYLFNTQFINNVGGSRISTQAARCEQGRKAMSPVSPS